jgi:hypothetical protein
MCCGCIDTFGLVAGLTSLIWLLVVTRLVTEGPTTCFPLSLACLIFGYGVAVPTSGGLSGLMAAYRSLLFFDFLFSVSVNKVFS